MPQGAGLGQIVGQGVQRLDQGAQQVTQRLGQGLSNIAGAGPTPLAKQLMPDGSHIQNVQQPNIKTTLPPMQ
jgi:hypothetical protein